MAADSPSYFRCVPLSQGIQKKEVLFHLYMLQQYSDHGRRHSNQRVVANPGNPGLFGLIAVNDWTIRSSPSVDADIVAHAQGLHTAADISCTGSSALQSWFFIFNIVFTDHRLKSSSLKVLGDYVDGRAGQWAIIGGTGEFAFAQGLVTYKEVQDTGVNRTRELHIRALCLTFPIHCIKTFTKIGPWGGDGGTEYDISELTPQRLESVTITSGDVIDSIAFAYIDLAGKKQILGPWGGDGDLTDSIIFDPLEVVKEVSGTTGIFGGDTVVTSLTFVTNVSTYGPFGKINGTTFSAPLKDDIVGFFARAGRLVNALGVYVRPSVTD